MSGKKSTPAPKTIRTATGKPVRKSLPRQDGFFRRNAFPVALFLLTFIVFGNAIFNDYALDDEFYTAGSNKLTKEGTKSIPEIFNTRTFNNSDGSGYSYRPVAVASFALEIHLFGEDPVVSHFINVLLYAFLMVLLFHVLRRWFTTAGDWFSFFVCLIFLVHPLHTEIVANIKCRDELLAMLFTLLSIFFLWKFRETRKWYFFALYPVCYFAAILSKHTIIPFLALIPLALWFFTDESWKKIGLYMIPLLVMAAITLYIEREVLPDQSRTYQEFENPLVKHRGLFRRSALASYVLGRYLWLHFIPHPLVYYYGQNYVPFATWTNGIAILSLVIHIGLGALAFVEMRKKTILGFGLLFYLIAIAPFSNLIFAAPGLMAERFTNASVLGFSIVVIYLIFKFLKKNPVEFRWKSPDYKTVRTVIVAVAAIYAVRSIARNETWENKHTLYGHDMQHLEESAKANMLYGALLSRDGMEARLRGRQWARQGNSDSARILMAKSNANFLEARKLYRKATEVAPYYHTAWSNLGTTYFFVEQPKEALPYFLESLRHKPDYNEGLFNSAMAYDQLGKPDSAIYFFRKSIAADSTYVTAYEQLSRVMVQQKSDTAAGIALLKLAIRNKPDDESPWNNLAKLYLEAGDTLSGAAAMEKAAEINPSNVYRLGNLAQFYRSPRTRDDAKAAYYESLYRREMAKQQGMNQGNQQGRRRR